MTYYHGTVKEYLPSILKEGLEPKINSWKACWPTGTPISDTEDEVVFVTSNKRYAEDFAKGRVKYLRATPGSEVIINFYDDCAARLTKDESASIEKTLPVVLEISLDDTSNLYPDPNFDLGTGEAYCYKGVIPPERIKVLNELDLGRHSKNAKLQGGRSSEKKVRKVRTSRAGASSR